MSTPETPIETPSQQGKSFKTSIACQMDQRFSYRVYLPQQLTNRREEVRPRLLIAVHSSTRDQQQLVHAFQSFSDMHNVAVLAPLFPSGIVDPEDHDNYKYISYRGIRFDLILLAMVHEAEERFNLDARKLLMFGFSGGGHFVHRFFYLHPKRLDAIFVAAPGSVTLLDPDHKWWVGTSDIDSLFDRTIDLPELRSVTIKLAVGELDLDQSLITHTQGSAHWMPGANKAGDTRVERLETLYQNYLDNGLSASLEVMTGVGHSSLAHVDNAKSFFSDFLTKDLSRGAKIGTGL